MTNKKTKPPAGKDHAAANIRMQIDYSRFRIVAVVDWVELEVRTLKATQGAHLKKAGARLFSHAHGINPQTGEKYDERVKNTVTTRFAIRIQAPERFAAITAALDTVRHRLDPSYSVEVLGMEVALDAYAKEGTTREELAGMTAHFLKGVNRVSPDHPRIYRLKNETRAIGSHRELIKALDEGFQIGIGNGNAERFQHGYLKTKDNHQDLLEDEIRARIEIRLQGKTCPVQTLEDLAGFDFSSLSDYFRFRQFDEPQTDLEQLLTERQICLGNIIDEDGELVAINRKKGGTRKNRRGTKASPLNEISRSRLRKLSERWKALAGRGKAPRPATIACGNSACLGSDCTHETQPETTPNELHQTPHHYRGNTRLQATPETSHIRTFKNRSLNTSYPPSLSNPDELPDLNNPDYPPLPNLTGDPAEI